MYPLRQPPCAQQLGLTWYGPLAPVHVDGIVKLGDAAPLQKAQVGGNAQGEQLDKVRTSKVAWIRPDESSKWLFEKLAEAVETMNATWYRFALAGFDEGLQYTVYDAAEGNGGHYDWHIDPHGPGGIPRKLSLVVQLSDPFDYEGGELQVWGATREVAPKQRGLVHLFPSWMNHRVTAVTRGVRKSLVAWVAGPDWR